MEAGGLFLTAGLSPVVFLVISGQIHYEAYPRTFLGSRSEIWPILGRHAQSTYRIVIRVIHEASIFDGFLDLWPRNGSNVGSYSKNYT